MLNHLFTGSKIEAVAAIVERYHDKGWGIVSFLYFANVMHWRLLEPLDEKAEKKKYQAYRKSLKKSHFLLPDGIALQLFYFWGWERGVWPHNLNGTDFIPFFLHQLVEQQQAIHLGIYSVYDPEIGKSQEELEKAIEHIQTTYGLDVARSQQSLYAERGKDVALGEYEKNLTHTDADIHILLVCTGTPHQEMWAHEHRDFFKKHKVLVFNAGGLIDYWSGFETRAPDWVIKTRVLETLWRILQHPKKNFKKLWWMFGIIRYRRSKLRH